MKKINAEQLIILQELLIKYSGGASGVRDRGLLESAIEAPFISFDGITNYPTLESKAARIAFGLIKNHPFVDENKRIGILAMLSFLEINGFKINCTDNQLVELGSGIANGMINEKTLLNFITAHT